MRARTGVINAFLIGREAGNGGPAMALLPLATARRYEADLDP